VAQQTNISDTTESGTPLAGRTALVTGAAEVVRLLVPPAAGYVTGQVVTVDGGG